MNIVGCQLNFNIGDFEGNSNKIIEYIEKHKHSDLVVFSELCISGYPPHDLMYEPDFIEKQWEAIAKILKYSKDVNCGIVIGCIRENKGQGKKFFNSLMLIEKGLVIFGYNKMLLPDYDIFDECRHFEAGNSPGIFKFRGEIIQFAICEDLWFSESNCYEKDPFSNTECDIIVAINASPSLVGKSEKRVKICKELVTRKNCELLYVNQVGGYDDVVFDGGSFWINKDTSIADFAGHFKEAICPSNCSVTSIYIDKNEFIYKQLVFGIKEYCKKCGFKKVVVVIKY